MFEKAKPAPGELGSETNPIMSATETIDTSALPWGDRSYLWVRTPSGAVRKCYYSYADYCMD